MIAEALLLPALILALSLLVLYKSSEVVISSTLVLARFFHISELAAGLLLISVATSLPELSVSVIAALEGQTPIVVGNVFGSNIADIALVLGFTIVMMGAVKYGHKARRELIRILIITSAIPLVMLTGMLSAVYGIGLLGIFLVYAYYALRDGKADGHGGAVAPKTAVLNALAFGFAVSIVMVSSKFAVDSAVAVATGMGVSRAFVGATAIALGTSLPELAVNYAAVKRRQMGIALGNILGSVMTNLTLVLGVAALISPLTANIYAFFTLVVFALLVNAVLWYFIQKGNTLRRNQGIALLLLYLLFLLMSIGVEIVL